MLGLITDSVIEDFLVVLEQAFNPSKVVVAVSGGDEVHRGYGVLVGRAAYHSCSDLNLRRPKRSHEVPSGLAGLYGCLKLSNVEHCVLLGP